MLKREVLRFWAWGKWVHYTNVGAERVAEIVSRELEAFVASRDHF